MSEWPVILGTPTLYRVMEVIKESDAMGLLASLQVDERHPGQARPGGHE